MSPEKRFSKVALWFDKNKCSIPVIWITAGVNIITINVIINSLFVFSLIKI